MTQPILLTGQVYAVEAPEWMNAYAVHWQPAADLCELNCYELGEYNEHVNEKSIDLPPAEWQLIGTTKEIGEEVAATIVEKKWDGWKDYDENNFHFDLTFMKASDSIRSLLTSKALDPNKNYVLIKKLK